MMIAAKPGIVRRAYDGFALLSAIHIALIVGFAGYFVATGRVDRSKVQRAVAILQGHDAESSEKPKPEMSEAANKPTSAPAQESAEMSVQDAEIIRREAERTKVELNQQLALVQSMMLKVSNEREAFKKERLSVSEQADDSVRVRRNEGFKKQVEIYDGLAPKVALEHLLALEDSDQAAKILMELDPRKAKKIIEAARSVEQARRMQSIMQRIQDVAPEQSAQLAGKEP